MMGQTVAGFAGANTGKRTDRRSLMTMTGLTDRLTKTALGALVRACYWGSTPTVRIWWVLQQAGMDWTKIGEFVDQCVAARVLEKHRYGTWLSMTGAGRQLYKDFDRIAGLADAL